MVVRRHKALEEVVAVARPDEKVERPGVTVFLQDDNMEIIEFLLRRTDGALALYIRRDDASPRSSRSTKSAGSGLMEGGLFIHGFRGHSRAKAQGCISVGDELLMINHVDVQGKYLEDIVAALKAPTPDEDVADDPDCVHIRVRRRFNMDDHYTIEDGSSEEEEEDEDEDGDFDEVDEEAEESEGEDLN